MRFNKAKCKVLHPGQGSPQHQSKLGNELIEGSPVEKDLEVLVVEKLYKSQQCVLAAQKANHTLHKHRNCLYPGPQKQRRGQQVERADSAPLLCSGETPPGVLCLSLEPSAQERHGLVGAGPEEGNEGQKDGTIHL